MKAIKLFAVVAGLLLVGSMQASADTTAYAGCGNNDSKTDYQYCNVAGWHFYYLTARIENLTSGTACASASVMEVGGWSASVTITANGNQNPSGEHTWSNQGICYAHADASLDDGDVAVYAQSRIQW